MAGRPGPSWSNITIEHDDEGPGADESSANGGAGEPTSPAEPTPAAHPRKQGLKTRMRQAWYGLGRSGKGGAAGAKNGGSAGSKIPISIEGGNSLAGWEMPSAAQRGAASWRGDLPPPPPGAYGHQAGGAALSPLGSLTWEADEEGAGGASMPGQKVGRARAPLCSRGRRG